ncbi:MAG: transcriptional repressor [Candidatus Saccharibacteria bacterium]|nr:transcriptional repressor [Candidatus Saccharibacteria bacterium]
MLVIQKDSESHGHFVTKQRMRLFFIMQKHNALTIRDLIKLLPRQDQATVYRNIRVFERLGIITATTRMALQVGS